MATYIISSKNLINSENITLATNLKKNASLTIMQSDENNNITSQNLSLQFQFTDFLFLILIILSVIISYVKISGKNYYNRIFTSITNFSYSNSFFKEKNLAHNLYNIFLIIVFIVSSSILLFVLSDYYNIKPFYESQWMQFLFYIIIVCSFVLIHTFVYYILGLLSDKIIIYRKYIFFFFNLLRVVGSFTVFLLFGAVFTENTIQIAFLTILFIVFFVAYLLRFYRLILIFFENQFSLYYMILYFCALEIIPILLMYKVMLNNFIQ